MRAIFAGMIFAAAISQPAMSADSKKPLKEPEPGTSVEMPYLIAPLTSGDTLLAYAYVSCKIIASSPSSAIDIRDKTAFIQDAFVRDVNTSTIGKADDPQTVDSPALTARLLADVKKVVKPGSVTGLRLIEVQIRLMRPGPVTSGGPS